MTAPPPVDVKNKSPEELEKIIRDLEKTCGTQDAGIHASSVREGRLFLDNKYMKELLQELSSADCDGRAKEIYCTWVNTPGGQMCVHDAAKEVLAKIAAKEGNKS